MAVDFEIVDVDLEPHPKADTLSIQRLGDLTCIVKTDHWKGVEKGVYIYADALVDTSRPEFSFLAPKARADGWYRIRACRLREVKSFGLMVPYTGEDLDIRHWNPPEAGEQQISTKGGKKIVDPDPVKGPTFPKYDLDNGRRYWKERFTLGEEVVVTEKLHGCLRAGTKLRMADGSSKSISDIEVGEFVLGMDRFGKVVSTEVTNTFVNDSTDDWLQITGTITGMGPGPSMFKLTMTPNHKVWVGDKYVECGKLKVGDSVYVLRTDFNLSAVQKSVLLGKMLGDGSYRQTSSAAGTITFGHRKQDEDYLNWTLRGLGEIGRTSTEQISGYGTLMVRGATSSLYEIKEKFGSFVSTGKKKIPVWVADELDPIAIAFWFMDDGSINTEEDQYARATFATCGFDRDDCEILVRGLKRFGISAKITEYGGNRRITLCENDSDKLFLLIAPYVPPCMERKLPVRYRGHVGWLPPAGGEYKQHMKQHTIHGIKAMPGRHKKYDIETETHNYFAGRVLVHNSNARFLLHEGQQLCGSRNGWKKRKSTLSVEEIAARIAEQGVDAEEAMAIANRMFNEGTRSNWWKAFEFDPPIEAFCRKYPGFTLIGEIYGASISGVDFSYDASSYIAFRAFDVVSPDGLYLDVEARSKLDWCGVRSVPELYRGPFDPKLIDEMAEGKSTLNPATIREGVVVESVTTGRKLKFVGVGYLDRKKD